MIMIQYYMESEEMNEPHGELDSDIAFFTVLDVYVITRYI